MFVCNSSEDLITKQQSFDCHVNPQIRIGLVTPPPPPPPLPNGVTQATCKNAHCHEVFSFITFWKWLLQVNNQPKWLIICQFWKPNTKIECTKHNTNLATYRNILSLGKYLDKKWINSWNGIENFWNDSYFSFVQEMSSCHHGFLMVEEKVGYLV